MPNSLTLDWLRRLLLLLAALLCSVAAAAEVPPPATLSALNRDIVTLRATVLGATPADRVERSRARLRAIPEGEIDEPIRAAEVDVEGKPGVQFFVGGNFLFTLLRNDVDPESQQSFEDLIKQTTLRLEVARRAWHDLRDRDLLLRGLLHTLAATVVLALLLFAVHRGGGYMLRRMHQWRDRLAARHEHVDLREFLARVVVGCAQVVQWLVLLALVLSWLRYVCGSFLLTEPLAGHLDNWLLGRLEWIAEGFASNLPGMFTVVIVLMVTRAIAEAIGYLFSAVQGGRLSLPLVHPDTISATRRIVSTLVWGLGIAIAYPYLPGSSSDAFKGLSVLFGVMITLGSTGIMSQAMGGLVIVYSRALRKGDFVEVNGVQGVVSEVASLATKIVNIRNEEVTIPNSVLIGSPIHNFSRLSGSMGTLLSTRVTIGYDVPWRQVHAMLLAAAQRTAGVREMPAPTVYQRALSDFYIEYDLFVAVDRPIDRVRILSELHAHIVDEFNTHGVQIMSPHFIAQPAEAVVVPPAQWYAAPAKPPA